MRELESRTEKLFKRVGQVLLIPLIPLIIHDGYYGGRSWTAMKSCEKYKDRVFEAYVKNPNEVSLTNKDKEIVTRFNQEVEDNLDKTWLLKYIVR